MKLKLVAAVLVVASVLIRCEEPINDQLLDSVEQNQQPNEKDILPVVPQPLISDTNNSDSDEVNNQKIIQDKKAEQLLKLHRLDQTLREPRLDDFAYYNKRLTSKKSEKREEAVAYFTQETALCDIKIKHYEEERNKKWNNALSRGGLNSSISMVFVGLTSCFAVDKGATSRKGDDGKELPLFSIPLVIMGTITSGVLLSLFEYIRYMRKSGEIAELQKPWIDNKIEIEKRFNWAESKQLFPKLQKESIELAEAYKKAYPLFHKNYDKRDIYNIEKK